MSYATLNRTLCVPNTQPRVSVAVQIASNFDAFAGSLWAYMGSSVPTGWLACDGASYLRADYADLFAALGGASSPWGLPDGTHFNVPDLRGRCPIGTGTGAGLTARTRAATGGVETHPLTAAENATHLHMQNIRAGVGSSYEGRATDYNATIIDQENTASAGSGTAHQTMQPWLAVNWAIKT